MRIGYFGGTVNEGTIDDVVDEARQAEADGFASYWAPNIFGHDALTVLAIVGREVPRIELGTSVVPTFPRHPFAIAQQCLTVSAASGGRLTLGIGLSHKIVIENMMGLSYDKPIRRIRDYLGILGPLSKLQPVQYEGEAYSSTGAFSAPGAEPFGVVVAALGPQMLKATAELAEIVAGILERDMGPDNSWHVQFDSSGRVFWESTAGTSYDAPARKWDQHFADFFFGLLPLESQM